MTRYSDAGLLKGKYSSILKQPPGEIDWRKTDCENKSEEAAQEIAKTIFSLNKNLNPEKETLEIVTYSSLGPVNVHGIMPVEGDLILIEGVQRGQDKPVSMIQHTTQLSLTFSKVDAIPGGKEADDGMQIGFVIFDELAKRKKSRTAAKRKKPSTKRTAKRKPKS